jgi:hypothetical protein
MTSVISSKWYLRFKGLASRLKITVHFLMDRSSRRSDIRPVESHIDKVFKRGIYING